MALHVSSVADNTGATFGATRTECVHGDGTNAGVPSSGALLVSCPRNSDYEIGWDRVAWQGATTSNSRSYCEEEQRCQAA